MNALTATALLLLAQAPATDPADITGVYAYRASDSRSNFSGVCTIQRHGEAYSVAYLVRNDDPKESDGIPEYVVGIGVRSGDTLAVGWAMATQKGLLRGVTQYRISGGERTRLTGRYASLPSDGSVRSEELRYLGAEK